MSIWVEVAEVTSIWVEVVEVTSIWAEVTSRIWTKHDLDQV